MRWLVLASVLSLSACGEEEPEPTLGESDPQGDFDGDGVANLEEEQLGLDPEDVDSDGDFCSDGREIEAGSDPLDIESTLYSEGGNWPCSLEGETLDASPARARVGKVFNDFGGNDQYGDTFSLFDFHQKEGAEYIVVDVSAEWCPPCQELAGYLDGLNDSFDNEPVRRAVNNGKVSWVTYMDQDAFGEPANKALTKRWHEAYPTQRFLSSLIVRRT